MAAKLTVRMTEDETWKFLTDGHTGILMTLRSDGVPIGMPVWYAVVDRKIYVGTRGKKLARIRRDARASFLVEAGERWAELRAVHLTGHARIVDPDDTLAARIAAEMDRKYTAFGTARTDMPEATRNVYATARTGVVELTPDARILNWDNRKLGVA